MKKLPDEMKNAASPIGQSPLKNISPVKSQDDQASIVEPPKIFSESPIKSPTKSAEKISPVKDASADAKKASPLKKTQNITSTDSDKQENKTRVPYAIHKVKKVDEPTPVKMLYDMKDYIVKKRQNFNTGMSSFFE